MSPSLYDDKTPEQVQVYDVETEDSNADFTAQEIKRARLKTDFIVLPLVVLMFIFLQFDRTNLGNALTDTFKKDVGVNGNDINLGQTLFTLGMVIWEIPSNFVGQRIGPNYWVPVIQVIWGVVTMTQACLVNRAGFLATRFLLATFEAGFIPGMAWYLTGFYCTNELAFRLAIYWGANSVASIISGIVALGLLSLSGKNGRHGWEYLFLIEGGLTIFVALAAFFLLGGRSVLGRLVYTSREADALAHVLAKDDPRKPSRKTEKLRLIDLRDTVIDWRLYGHIVSAFLSSVMLTPINTYGPSLIKSLGFKGYSANAMTAPGAAMALVVSLLLAKLSDRARERAVFIAIAMIGSTAGCFWLAFPPAHTSRGVLYAGYVVTVGFMGTGQAINAAWLSSRMDERKRPIALACYVMSIQIAGFVGSNVFKPQDAPRYRPGLIICGACVLAAAVVVLLWRAAYAFDDRRQSRGVGEQGHSDVI